MIFETKFVIDFANLSFGRQLLGEDLGPLNIKELENLEHQLETSLKQIRSIKVISTNYLPNIDLSEY